MRVFKTPWFHRAARRAGIADSELCLAAHDAAGGRANDLGGGVFKKRLNRNLHRAIILAKGGEQCVYVDLFAKQDQANITKADLADFRKLATIYAGFSLRQVTDALASGRLKEICREQAKV